MTADSIANEDDGVNNGFFGKERLNIKKFAGFANNGNVSIIAAVSFRFLTFSYKI